jgi:hypothetical protein
MSSNLRPLQITLHGLTASTCTVETQPYMYAGTVIRSPKVVKILLMVLSKLVIMRLKSKRSRRMSPTQTSIQLCLPRKTQSILVYDVERILVGTYTA